MWVVNQVFVNPIQLLGCSFIDSFFQVLIYMVVNHSQFWVFIHQELYIDVKVRFLFTELIVELTD